MNQRQGGEVGVGREVAAEEPIAPGEVGEPRPRAGSCGDPPRSTGLDESRLTKSSAGDMGRAPAPLADCDDPDQADERAVMQNEFVSSSDELVEPGRVALVWGRAPEDVHDHVDVRKGSPLPVGVERAPERIAIREVDQELIVGTAERRKGLWRVRAAILREHDAQTLLDQAGERAPLSERSCLRLAAQSVGQMMIILTHTSIRPAWRMRPTPG